MRTHRSIHLSVRLTAKLLTVLIFLALILSEKSNIEDQRVHSVQVCINHEPRNASRWNEPVKTTDQLSYYALFLVMIICVDIMGLLSPRDLS